MTTLEEIKYVTDIAKNIGKNLKDDGILNLKDLISEGWIALQEEKKKYNPSKGSTLKTFAYRRVCGAMKDLIYSQAPRGYRRQGKTGKPIPVDVCEYQEHDRPAQDDIESRVELSRVNKVIVSRKLRARERFILIKRAEGEELQPLAKKFHISRTRVCQIRREAAEKVWRVIVRKEGK
jgi:RNA polymerase sigma factor (sigma-70 family)